MPLLRIRLLCFSALIFVNVCICFADAASQLGDNGKCGRDCAYYVCQSFGKQTSLDEIDQELEYRTDVSFAELRKVLENRGLFCKSFVVGSWNIGKLQDTIDKSSGSLYLIAAIPTSSESQKHFVTIIKCSGSDMTVFDVSANRVFSVNTGAYKGKSITVPILLISDKPVQYILVSHFEFLPWVICFIGICLIVYGLCKNKCGYFFCVGLFNLWRYCCYKFSLVSQH